MLHLKVGDKAPAIKAKDQNGDVVTLKQFAGKKVILYFYPEDDTPVCTVEACNFRDANSDLQKLGAVVLGVSKDSVKSHAKFAEKFKLNFPLLSDESKEMIEAYGAWGVKKFMGREFAGIRRNTVLINPQGEIVKEYEKVDPKTHTIQILQDLKALMTT